MACSPLLMAQTGMTDQQVLEYVKQGMAAGKDQRQMATELARRGVTREQAERIKKLYEEGKLNNPSAPTQNTGEQSRMRQLAEGQDMFGQGTDKQQAISQMLEAGNTLGQLNILQQDSLMRAQQENEVFGRNIFNTTSLTFEPSVNLATPQNYRLGPGDEVIIDIWGTSQKSRRTAPSISRKSVRSTSAA